MNVITIKHSTSRSKDTYGLPRLTASCNNLSATQVGYGYNLELHALIELLNKMYPGQFTSPCLEAGYKFVVEQASSVGLDLTYIADKRGRVTYYLIG